MNKAILTCALTLLTSLGVFAQSFQENANSFFGKYVKNGRVDYKAIQKDPAQLKSLVKHIETTNYELFDRNTQLAYLINTYNILVIDKLTRNYPTSSPMKISGFFQEDNLINGKKVSLDALENKILRPTYNDARLHFVLVCGAVSCPPIVEYAYSADKINMQLDLQTKLAINDPDFIQYNKTDHKVQISEIFKWYEVDFKKAEGSVKSFINKYRNKPFTDDTKFVYYTYNWAINEVSSEEKLSMTEKPALSVIQSLTPSALLKHGQWDASIFNNLYTETSSAGSDGEQKTNPSRGSFFTSTLKFNYGISKNSRINVGIIANIKSNKKHEKRTDDPSEVLNFKSEDKISRAGLASIAPAIKFTPFKNISNFSIQTSFQIPVSDKPEGDNDKLIWLDKSSPMWSNQFFFDKSFFNDKFQFFAEIDINYNFKNDGFFSNSINIPMTVFLSYFPSSKLTFYVQGQEGPTWWINDKNLPYQDFTQVGIGGKIQLLPSLNLEGSITDFVRGINSGTGETYNIGLRYVLIK